MIMKYTGVEILLWTLKNFLHDFGKNKKQKKCPYCVENKGT